MQNQVKFDKVYFTFLKITQKTPQILIRSCGQKLTYTLQNLLIVHYFNIIRGRRCSLYVNF